MESRLQPYKLRQKSARAVTENGISTPVDPATINDKVPIITCMHTNFIIVLY